MFPEEKNQISPKKVKVSHQKKLYFQEKKWYFPGIIDIFVGKKFGKRMINLGEFSLLILVAIWYLKKSLSIKWTNFKAPFVV